MSGLFDSLVLLFPIMFCFTYIKDLAAETATAAYNDVLQFFARCRRAMYWSLYLMLFLFTLACVKVFTDSMNAMFDGEKPSRGAYYNYLVVYALTDLELVHYL
ncbi:uncharacterized protein BKA55DRAFT_544700 [Fusarium redolens]|uniref:Uncharacterized protein n=1 Tax=Fusarium redolens TaxID=48865 RepID=A0A9P9G4I9_FUSRE|nr:uncharacterized protein BKA55DRAFT_544700 [Fusarium redolens]KAH7232366.1 hypothetical protein BKA55DRAFT_544700 [Fusarium redolens]